MRCFAAEVIAAGALHSLAIDRETGDAWAWGVNSSGQLGDGTINQSAAPVRVTGLPKPSLFSVNDLSGGGSFSLAAIDGNVWAWGDNQSGQLATGSASPFRRAVPAKVAGVSGIVDVSAGDQHALAVRGSDGTVWSWGLGTLGRLGNGGTATQYSPVQVTGLTNVTHVAAGAAHSLALRRDGTVWAWGNNANGQLGDGTRTSRSTPVQVWSLTSVVEIAAGVNFSLARRSDGTVWAWGDNRAGQLGRNFVGGDGGPAPVQRTNGQPFTGMYSIGAGGGFGLAANEDGAVYTWGTNHWGSMPRVDTTPVIVPGEMLSFRDNILGQTLWRVGMLDGGNHAMAMATNGHVTTWGFVTYALGMTIGNPVSTPVVCTPTGSASPV